MAAIDIDGFSHEVHEDVADLIHELSIDNDDHYDIILKACEEGNGLVISGKLPSSHFFNQ